MVGSSGAASGVASSLTAAAGSSPSERDDYRQNTGREGDNEITFRPAFIDIVLQQERSSLDAVVGLAA